MYFPSSENKGTDQLRAYHKADLRLCFHICRLLFFYGVAHILPPMGHTNDLIKPVQKVHIHAWKFGNELELIEALRPPATVHNCLIGYQSQSFSYDVGFKLPGCL